MAAAWSAAAAAHQILSALGWLLDLAVVALLVWMAAWLVGWGFRGKR